MWKLEYWRIDRQIDKNSNLKIVLLKCKKYENKEVAFEKVEKGLQTLEFVEVLKGLNENDQVVMPQPKQ